MKVYGDAPRDIGRFTFALPEVMYYLYLPVWMAPEGHTRVRLPPNVECCRPIIYAAMKHYRESTENICKYIYLSARKGWATPDAPLNRPGWHCDGFGTDDMNYVWWKGPGTRFLVGSFSEISDDHVRSLHQFEGAAEDFPDNIIDDMPEQTLYKLSPTCIHATPLLTEGCMRQYVKVSFSNERYNLYNNSHNYLFDYDWPMVDRALVRNDTSKAQRDYA